MSPDRVDLHTRSQRGRVLKAHTRSNRAPLYKFLIPLISDKSCEVGLSITDATTVSARGRTVCAGHASPLRHAHNRAVRALLDPGSSALPMQAKDLRRNYGDFCGETAQVEGGRLGPYCHGGSRPGPRESQEISGMGAVPGELRGCR